MILACFSFLNNLYIKRTKTSFIVMANMLIWVILEWKLIFEMLITLTKCLHYLGITGEGGIQHQLQVKCMI